MEFVLKVGGFETEFANNEMSVNENDTEFLINFLDFTEDNAQSFISTKSQELIIDRKNGIIAFRIPEIKRQFAIQLDSGNNIYDLFEKGKLTIYFSFKKKSGEQYQNMYFFKK